MQPSELEAKFQVLAPVGDHFTEEFQQADPIPALAGMRIAFLWDMLFSGDFVFDQIAEELSGTYDDITFVGYKTFGDIHGGDEHQVLANLPELFREHRIDAAVVGVGA
jgi:hypothetical protein